MREFGDRLARELGGAEIEVMGLIGDSELGQGQRRAAEAVGLDRVGSRREITAMDVENEIGTALVQNLGAILVALIILVESQR